MERQIISNLIRWKNDKTRKPLVFQGARQVGKSYILKVFGEREFPNTHFIDFTKQKDIAKVFEPNIDPIRIIQDLSIYLEKKINLRDDLIVFDEIQECPQAITSLKYLYEEYPQAQICAAGSLLGLGLNQSNFPVGKVEFLTLYPMTFGEFLLALGKDQIYQSYAELSMDNLPSQTLHEKLWQYLKHYFFTGGMPEAVAVFASNQDNLLEAFGSVRKIQEQIVISYRSDIAKHSGKTNAMYIEAVLNNVPAQLAREKSGVDKFQFKEVLANNSNFVHLAGPIQWLLKAGLLHQVKICSHAQTPLDAYTTANRFKLYLLDIGLLGAMCGLSAKSVIEYDYGSYKGYVAENYVLQELIAKTHKSMFSWNENTAEVDFLLDIDNQIIPVEVKAGLNSRAKSLLTYADKYKPERQYIFSGRLPEKKDRGLYMLPLYMVDKLIKDA